MQHCIRSWFSSLKCLSVLSNSVSYEAPLSMEFSTPESWSGWPFPSPGYLPDPGTEPGSPALQVDSIPSEPLWFFCVLLWFYFLFPNPAQYVKLLGSKWKEWPCPTPPPSLPGVLWKTGSEGSFTSGAAQTQNEHSAFVRNRILNS